MWVQLLTVRMIEINGVGTNYRPGDWVDIGKQTALRWIAEGIAISPHPINELLPPGSGVVFWRDASEAVRSRVTNTGIPCREFGTPQLLPFARTLFIGGDISARTGVIPIGMRLLDRWQVVCPLMSYELLAQQLGSEEDRALTKNVIHDLRVPVYQPDFLFVRRGLDGEALVARWLAEIGPERDDRLAFLRALYITKPQICAAPASWLDRTAGK